MAHRKMLYNEKEILNFDGETIAFGSFSTRGHIKGTKIVTVNTNGIRAEIAFALEITEQLYELYGIVKRDREAKNN